MSIPYDKHYAESDHACGQPFAPFSDFATSLSTPARVLDLGCGQGRDTLLFARLGHAVVGVDVSSVGIGQLRAIARAEGLSVMAEVADVVSYAPDGAFNVVLLDRVLHMLPNDDTRRRVLATACAATAPGGHLLISEYPKQHDMLRAFFADRPRWCVRTDHKGFLLTEHIAER